VAVVVVVVVQPGAVVVGKIVVVEVVFKNIVKLVEIAGGHFS